MEKISLLEGGCIYVDRENNLALSELQHDIMVKQQNSEFDRMLQVITNEIKI